MDVERTSSTAISRRTVTKAMAWAAPAIAVAATVPLAAASLRKDPGINGWVLISTDPGRCGATLDFNSNPRNGGPTPDGAPFGLYIYDVESINTFGNAKMILWVIGNRPQTGAGQIQWSSESNHSSLWGAPTYIGTAVKPDGETYTGYEWNYTGAILASDSAVTDPDGIERLRLQDFHVSAWVGGVSAGGYRCNVTYWVERQITIDPDGNGPLPATVHKFQRRRGTLGDMSGYDTTSLRKAKAMTEVEAEPLPANEVG